MKKLLILFFAFSVVQVMGQDITPLTKSDSSSKTAMIDVDALTKTQMENLTKKLNLNEAQQQVISNMVLSQLKKEKFQKLLTNIGADKIMDTSKSEEINEQVQSALLLDKDFQKSMSYVLDTNQKKSMEDYTPK